MTRENPDAKVLNATLSPINKTRQLAQEGTPVAVIDQEAGYEDQGPSVENNDQVVQRVVSPSHPHYYSNAPSKRGLLASTTELQERSFHPSSQLHLYSPILQRQQWGDEQCLPHVNWGDLFIDLFYVAATYNVTNIVVMKGTTREFLRAILYSAGTFLPVMSFWLEKLFFDSRFVVRNNDDTYHQLYHLVFLMTVASAIVHIRSVDLLSHPSESIAMFAFCFSLAFERLLTMSRYLEIYFFGVGQCAILKNLAIGHIKRGTILLVPYTIAAIIAGVAYFGNDNNNQSSIKDSSGVSSNSGHRWLTDASGTNSTSTNHSDSSVSTLGEANHAPIYLILFGFVVNQLYFAIQIIFCFPTGGKHKEFTVPMNVEFAIHRYGEFTMLMLGESIFSLLVVWSSSATDGSHSRNYDSRYYATFFGSLLTVILLQYLHFQSQPHNPDHFALRRSKNAGIMWALINQVYSLSLVLLGSSFTFFLTYFNYITENQNSESYNNEQLLQTSAFDTGYNTSTSNATVDYSTGTNSESHHRFLNTDTTDSTSQFVQARHLFAISLAVCFACLDIMTLLHLGWEESYDRCVCPQTRQKNYTGIILVIIRVSWWILTATLCQWLRKPESLAWAGVFCVLSQLWLRKMGVRFLLHRLKPISMHCSMPTKTDVGTESKLDTKPTVAQDQNYEESDDNNEDDDSEADWPNITQARAERSTHGDQNIET